MTTENLLLKGMSHSPRDMAALLTLSEKVEIAIALLKECEPEEGYYLAFSGGKDSCAIKALAQMAGVKFDTVFNNTTVEAPELVKFMRKHHADAIWERHQKPAMLSMVANAPKTPPTRMARWCCEKYKEGGGKGRVKVLGVRAAESKGRAANWKERVVNKTGGMKGEYVCPIVYWSDDEVWGFLKGNEVPYCSLYDEGFTRIGCVGCPLAGPTGQDKEFERWPAFERAWKKAVIKNWENRKDGTNSRTGEPLFQAKFATGEEFWRWWRYKELPDYGEDCQMEQMFTN